MGGLRFDRPILVGELNPYGTDPRYALYPHPANSAGARLQSKILGLPRLAYLKSFHRANLCLGTWSAPSARKVARTILDKYGRVVLLGAKVCAAFEVEFRPFTTIVHGETGQAICVLPHPSGRCLIWNEPDAVGRARRALAQHVWNPAAESTSRTARSQDPLADAAPTTERGRRAG